MDIFRVRWSSRILGHIATASHSFHMECMRSFVVGDHQWPVFLSLLCALFFFSFCEIISLVSRKAHSYGKHLFLTQVVR